MKHLYIGYLALIECVHRVQYIGIDRRKLISAQTYHIIRILYIFPLQSDLLYNLIFKIIENGLLIVIAK